MKQASKVLLPLALIIFASCFQIYWAPGEVGNVPEWLDFPRSTLDDARELVSSWAPWPGETHPLADMLSGENADKRQYAGYYQLSFSNPPVRHNLDIRFSDYSHSSFTIWLGPVFGGDYVNIPQADPDVFEFDGRLRSAEAGFGPHILTHDYDQLSKTDFPEALVKFRYERIEEYDGHRWDPDEFYCFRIKVTLLDDGRVLFDEIITSEQPPWIVRQNPRPSWLPAGKYLASKDDPSNWNFEIYSEYLGGDYVWRIHSKDSKIATRESFPSSSLRPIYSTLSQEEIDNTQQRVLYKVDGLVPDSSLYYIEAQRTSSETVEFRYMDKDRNVLEEGTGWLSSAQKDLGT